MPIVYIIGPVMRVLLIPIVLLPACGRVWFDPAGSARDAAVADEPGVAGTFTAIASIAECIALAMPDPDLCRQVIAPTRMRLDANDQAFDPPEESAVFLRFEPIPEVTSASIITDVTLTLTLSPEGTEPADKPGNLYRVECFTRADLFVKAPTRDATPVRPDAGTFPMPGEAVLALPVRAARVAEPTCFGLYASDTDGTNYWNTDGPAPPRLTVTMR